RGGEGDAGGDGRPAPADPAPPPRPRRAGPPPPRGAGRPPTRGGAKPLLLGIGVRRAVTEESGRGEKGRRYPAHPSSGDVSRVPPTSSVGGEPSDRSVARRVSSRGARSRFETAEEASSELCDRS